MSSKTGIGEYAERVIGVSAAQLVGQHGFTEADREDLAQELRLHLLKRKAKFDPSRAQWNTFVARVVEHKVVSIVRRQASKCRDSQQDGESLNEPGRSKTGKRGERGDLITEEEGRRRTAQDVRSTTDAVNLSLDAKQFLAGLPAPIRDVSELVMQGHSVQDIARDLHLSRATIQRRIAVLRQMGKDSDLRDYLLRR